MSHSLKTHRVFVIASLVMFLVVGLTALSFQDTYKLLKIIGYPTVQLKVSFNIQPPTSKHIRPIAFPKVLASSAIRCMARNMYYEARGEGKEGMIAVGYVVTNRAKSGLFPTDVCRVVRQKLRVTDSDKVVCQFSWICQLGNPTPSNQKLYAEAVKLSKQVLRDEVPNPIGDSLFYHTKDASDPLPHQDIALQSVIGNHEFYTLTAGS